MKRDCFCCCLCGGFGLSLFFVAPFSLLAVFFMASAFNQDMSTWNTGAVTTMAQSKCTFSPSLWPRRLPLWSVVVEYIHVRQLEVRRVTSLTRAVLFCLFVVGTGTFCCCLCDGIGPSFLCCALSCSVCWRICLQTTVVLDPLAEIKRSVCSRIFGAR